MTDIEKRLSHVEGEIRGMQHIADALFKLSDRMHDEMTAMRAEFKDDMRASHWERLGIILAMLTVAASIYFSGIGG